MIEARLPSPPTWYVAQGEAPAYVATGAKHVVEAGALTKARNQALEDAFAQDAWCLQISDDLTHCHRALSKKKKVEITVWQAARELKMQMMTTKARFGGVAPTANEFYFSPAKPVKTCAFVVGDFILVAPSKPRFDESMRLKEDYQLTLDHLKSYGRICRCDNLLLKFKHRDNPGGAVTYRTPELEQETIRQLKAKYRGLIKDNPRRPNEILLAIR